ncbi:unnamed protein product [Caenorhabditis sp. 36 PRJEB53466]|nr:unnamed protein product [Caenorhabditis sp. 36 PRJEB53466]
MVLKKTIEEENNSEVAQNRKRAGIEWSADIEDWICCFPQKYALMGLCVSLVIISIISWIGSGYYAWTIWTVLATIFLGLIVFIPDLFGNLLNLCLNFVCWVAFFVLLFVNFIQVFVWKGWVTDSNLSNEEKERQWSHLNFMLACIPLEMLITAAICFFLLRFVKFAYDNR